MTDVRLHQIERILQREKRHIEGLTATMPAERRGEYLEEVEAALSALSSLAAELERLEKDRDEWAVAARDIGFARDVAIRERNEAVRRAETARKALEDLRANAVLEQDSFDENIAVRIPIAAWRESAAALASSSSPPESECRCLELRGARNVKHSWRCLDCGALLESLAPSGATAEETSE